MDAAESVANMLEADAGFVQDDFTAPKIRRLRQILDPVVKGERASTLIEGTSHAVTHLLMSRSAKKVTPKLAREKFDALAKASIAFVRAWEAVLSEAHLRYLIQDMFSLHAQLDGKLLEREHILNSLAPHVQCIGTDSARIVNVLRSSYKTRDPAGYLCVLRIGRTWLDEVGSAPTLTRNVDAVSGPQETRFERYLGEAIPDPPIGPGIIRSAVSQVKKTGGN